MEPVRAFTIEQGLIALRYPIPAPEALLELLYQARANGQRVGMILEIMVEVSADEIEQMLESQKAHPAWQLQPAPNPQPRAETPVQRETEEPE